MSTHPASTTSPIRRHAVVAHARWHAASRRSSERLEAIVGRESERGDVTPRTIMVFIFAALALSVGAIIKAKVEGKANAIAVD